MKKLVLERLWNGLWLRSFTGYNCLGFRFGRDLFDHIQRTRLDAMGKEPSEIIDFYNS